MIYYFRRCVLLVVCCQIVLYEDIEAFQVYNFTSTYADGSEHVLTTESECRSPLLCASACTNVSPPGKCTGFHHDAVSQTCELYSRLVFGTFNPDSGKIIYKPDKPCPTHLGFSQVRIRGHSLCLKYFRAQKVFEKAKSHCESMSARLLHLDDLDLKFTAVGLIMQGSVVRAWVGYHDREVEGEWKATWRSVTLHHVPWAKNQPGFNTNYNCAQLDGTYQLKAFNCMNHAAYICEAT